MTNPAEGHEGYMEPALFSPWARRLVQLADPGPGERVLDVRCSTRIVARRVEGNAMNGALQNDASSC